MNRDSSHINHALTILTIGTASLGFGIFKGDFLNSDIFRDLRPLSLPEMKEWLALMKLFCAVMVTHRYMLLCKSVWEIVTQNSPVSGRELAYGQLYQLFWEMLYVILIFVFGVFEEPPARLPQGQET